MEIKINDMTKAEKCKENERLEMKDGNRIPTFWQQKAQKRRGTDEMNEVHTFYCSFLFIFLYGNVIILKNYLYVFPETRSHNKVDKFQQIL